MNPRKPTIMKPTLLSLGAFVFLIHGALGQSFTYVTESSQTTITGFSAEPSGAVTVPLTLNGATVTAIERGAFKDRTGITSIAFAAGSGVTKIGTGAFQGCTGLTSVSFPSGVTALPAQALQGCTALQSTTLPTSLLTIGDAALADCRSLTSLSLPTTVTSIGQAAFSNCRGLVSMTIPSGVTVIPDQAFLECRALGSISLPAGITKIGNSAFFDCPGFTSFSLPTSTTSVGNDAFGNCTGITAFTVNTALTTFGDRVFNGCATLAAINVNSSNTAFASTDGVLFNKAGNTLLLCPPGKAGAYSVPASVTTIAAGAFAHCSGLSSVALPATLSSLPADAFYYADGISSLALPSSLSSIGDWAFAGCTGLEGVTIPASVTTLGADAFHHASALEWALFKGNAPTTGDESFDDTAESFTVFYLSSATGFTSPTWLGYPAQVLGIPGTMVDWLAGLGISPGTDVETDPNGSGVSLLMAYALGLDPNANPVTGLPKPTLANGLLSLSFKGNSSGITYSVETSENLSSWTTSGVTLSSPDSNGMRTASVPASGADSSFLRIVASY